MWKLGFSKIAFSNSEGNIEIHKLQNYSKIHLSSSQRIKIKKRQAETLNSLKHNLTQIRV